MRSDVSRTTIGSKPSAIKPSGGARRDRTDDLMLAKHALSQLSYGPVPEDECFTSVVETSLYREKTHPIKVVGLGRLELPTSRLSSARSNQLSYKPDEASCGTQGCASRTRRKGRETRTAADSRLFLRRSLGS